MKESDGEEEESERERKERRKPFEKNARVLKRDVNNSLEETCDVFDVLLTLFPVDKQRPYFRRRVERANFVDGALESAAIKALCG